MEQLVKPACHIQRRAAFARALATFHGVKRNSGVKPKRQRFGEELAVDAADINRARLRVQQTRASFVNLRRNAQSTRIVVAGAHGNHAKLRTRGNRQRHQAVHHLVDNAVAAKRHHGVGPVSRLRKRARMTRPRRARNRYRIGAQRSAQQLGRPISRRIPRPALRSRIRNQQHPPQQRQGSYLFQRPVLPPSFSSRRTSMISMPRSTALHIS